MLECYVAVDIGASGGRVILGYIENERLVTRELHRFANHTYTVSGRLCWGIEGLFDEIIKGLSRVKETGVRLCSVGIDTWGVDFVLFDKYDRLLGGAVSYRDSRTVGLPEQVEEIVSFEELYARTGIQKQAFNTIYQLLAVKHGQLNDLQQAERFLMLPDYFAYRLCGVKTNEYTNASTTGLLNPHTGKWDYELIEKVGLPTRIFRSVSMPFGTIGTLKDEFVDLVGSRASVVFTCTHDTASAVLATPIYDEDTDIFLSSGTWSLMGSIERDPITTAAARNLNFTNEGGYTGKIRFLKNIMGLWLIQSVRREDAPDMSFAELSALAAREQGEIPIIDVNATELFAPESMSGAVRSLCDRAGYAPPKTLAQTCAVIYHSLAHSYAQTVKELSSITGKTYKNLFIVGGGSQDMFLNRLCKEYTGLSVFAGPTEASAIGNIMCQIMGHKMAYVEEGRRLIRDSFNIYSV